MAFAAMTFPRTFSKAIAFLGAFLLPALLFSQSSTTKWQGTTTTEWRNASNWDSGVPGSTRDAIVSKSDPSVKDAYVPVPSGGDTAQTRTLTLQNGGVLQFDSAGVLIVHGTDKLLNLGVVWLGKGILICKNNISFQNGGTFYAEGGSLFFSGMTWENKQGSVFSPGTSTVTVNGSGFKTIAVDTAIAGFSFYDVDLLNQGTVTIQGNVTVLNDCYLAAGCTLNIPVGSSFTVNGAFTGDGVITGGGSYTPLPVQLVAFSASAEGTNAFLQWTTAAEVNNYGFDVERRRIGATEQQKWEQIGFVRGNGTTTSAISYSFVDQGLLPGRYAYRIRQIDFDGSFAYYHAAEIELAGIAAEFMLGSNYPNPFNPSTTIEFTVPENGRAILAIFNMIGEKVATLFDGEAEAGRPYLTFFQGASLPSGLYFSRLEFGDRKIIKKMVLLK